MGRDHGAQCRNVLEFRHHLGILPPCEKRVQIALAVLLVAVGGVITWQALRLREPVYQGRPLIVWIKEGMSRGPRILAPSEIDVDIRPNAYGIRSEEHTSELQSREN